LGWEFYFQRSNYWYCNPYTGDEDVESGLGSDELSELAVIPQTQTVPESCPD